MALEREGSHAAPRRPRTAEVVLALQVMARTLHGMAAYLRCESDEAELRRLVARLARLAARLERIRDAAILESYERQFERDLS